MTGGRTLGGLQPGDPERLGSYLVRARVGAGGTGVVFLAESADGQAVAIKVIQASVAGDAAFRDRFRPEVEAARRVRSPVTVAVLDADADADLPWVASEYVEGPNLQEVVEAAIPTPAAAAGILRATAEALVAIHQVGIIHRDLKPTKVLCPSGGAKVIVFGIAPADNDAPAWLAPEQVSGQPLTPAVDVFAWGCLAVYTLTGRLAFGGDDNSTPAMIYRMVYADADLSGVPAELVGPVSAALAKRPEDRPQVGDLVRLLSLLPASSPPPVVAGAVLPVEVPVPVSAPSPPAASSDLAPPTPQAAPPVGISAPDAAGPADITAPPPQPPPPQPPPPQPPPQPPPPSFSPGAASVGAPIVPTASTPPVVPVGDAGAGPPPAPATPPDPVPVSVPPPGGGAVAAPGRKRRVRMLAGIAIGVVAAIAVLAFLGRDRKVTKVVAPQTVLSTIPAPASTTTSSLIATPAGATPLTQLLPSDVDTSDDCSQNESPPSLTGLIDALICTPKNLPDGQIFAFQFDNAADFAASVTTLNKFKGFDASTAGSTCPPGSGAQGQTGWHNATFPALNGQVLECLSVGTNNNQPDYIWTYPAANVVIDAQAAANTSFADLDTWWTKDAPPHRP